MNDRPRVLPEVRTILERAWAGRVSLVALIESLPAAYWDRSEAAGEWSARNHLEHLATADDLVGRLVTASAPAIDEALAAERVAAMAAVERFDLADLLNRLHGSRSRLLDVVAGLQPDVLSRDVQVPPSDPWTPTVRFTVRSYLAQWAEHDELHEGAIRRAVANPPGPGELAAAALIRKQQRSR